MRDAQISVTGGRKLAYTDIGEPGWPCVFFFHGAPSSRLRLAYMGDRRRSRVGRWLIGPQTWLRSRMH